MSKQKTRHISIINCTTVMGKGGFRGYRKDTRTATWGDSAKEVRDELLEGGGLSNANPNEVMFCALSGDIRLI